MLCCAGLCDKMSEDRRFMQRSVLPELPSSVLQRILALATDLSDIRSVRLVSTLACATMDRHVLELRIRDNIDKHSTRKQHLCWSTDTHISSVSSALRPPEAPLKTCDCALQHTCVM